LIIGYIKPAFVTIVLAVCSIVAIICVAALLSRGKQLNVQRCNHVFNAPVMDEKLIGYGWNFPYTGKVKCPKCGNKRSRRSYNKVEKLIKKA